MKLGNSLYYIPKQRNSLRCTTQNNDTNFEEFMPKLALAGIEPPDSAPTLLAVGPPGNVKGTVLRLLEKYK